MKESSHFVVLRFKNILEARSLLKGGREWMERLSRLSGVSGVERNATTFWSKFSGLEKGLTPEVSGIAFKAGRRTVQMTQMTGY